MVALYQDVGTTYPPVDYIAQGLVAFGWLLSIVYGKALGAKERPSWPLLVFWILGAGGAALELAVVASGDLSTSTAIAQLCMTLPRAVFSVSAVSVTLWSMTRGTSTETKYTAINSDEGAADAEDAQGASPSLTAAAAVAAAKGAQSPFTDFMIKVKKLLPFIWPKHDFNLQTRLVLCMVFVLSVRVVNVFVPILNKNIIDALAVRHQFASYYMTNTYGQGESGEIYFPLADILMYTFLRLLQGGAAGSMGLLNNIRNLLYIPVGQFTNREVAVSTFSHLHDLSLRYHLQRKTGEVLRVIDRGTASITNLLETLVFSILPTFLDIGIAIVYFIVRISLSLSHLCACD